MPKWSRVSNIDLITSIKTLNIAWIILCLCCALQTSAFVECLVRPGVVETVIMSFATPGVSFCIKKHASLNVVHMCVCVCVCV